MKCEIRHSVSKRMKQTWKTVMGGKSKKGEWRHWLSGGWEINRGFHFMYCVSLREEENMLREQQREMALLLIQDVR